MLSKSAQAIILTRSPPRPLPRPRPPGSMRLGISRILMVRSEVVLAGTVEWKRPRGERKLRLSRKLSKEAGLGGKALGKAKEHHSPLSVPAAPWPSPP